MKIHFYNYWLGINNLKCIHIAMWNVSWVIDKEYISVRIVILNFAIELSWSKT